MSVLSSLIAAMEKEYKEIDTPHPKLPNVSLKGAHRSQVTYSPVFFRILFMRPAIFRFFFKLLNMAGEIFINSKIKMAKWGELKHRNKTQLRKQKQTKAEHKS